MKQLYYFFLLLFTISAFAILQSDKIDPEVLSFGQIKELFWKNENDKTKQFIYAKAYLSKAKKENNAIEKARGYYLLSIPSEDDIALIYLDNAIEHSKDLNDPKFPAYAYSKKGFIYKKQYQYKKALDNFLVAESIAKKNNPDMYYDTKFTIGVLRSEELGEVDEALLLYEDCLKYYNDKDIRNDNYSYSYQILLFALADAYKTLNKFDSATYYNKLGYVESKITNNNHINSLFTLNEGANKVFKGEFKEALDSITKVTPHIIASKDTGNILATFYYTAKAHDGLKNKDKAIENFIKVDSIYNVTNRITPEFTSGYPYLISHFKKSGDKVNQLKYLTKYMSLDSILQINYKELTKKLQKEYDTPNLLEEKENLIESLKTDNIKSYWHIGFLIIIILIITSLAIYQYKQKKKSRRRFEEIILKLSISKETNLKPEEEIKIAKTKIEQTGIAEELVNLILEKLDCFENKKEYLEPNITVQMLSTAFDTNSKYVSKTVNVYKGKTFVQYINDLRIEHAITQLQENKILRKYSIQALALEFGFNTAESFSSAFYKKAGIKPTYFIKELDSKVINQLTK